MPYQAHSPPRPTRGKETRLSSGIATNGPMVQREVGVKFEVCRDKGGFRTCRRLANLLSLSYEAMFAWQWDGPIEFWNAGAERLYGFSPSEAVGRSSHTLLQTKFPVEFSELRSQLLNERSWSGELRHICKDGDEVTVDSRMQLLGDDTVLEVNRDVTQIKALNIRQSSRSVSFAKVNNDCVRWHLSSSLATTQLLAKTSMALSQAGIGVRNVSLATLPKRLLASPSQLSFHKTGKMKSVRFLTRIRRGERIDHFETVRQRKHGSLIVVSLTVSPVKNAEGKIVGASKIARDITEQKRAQEQIATLAREAEHRSKNLLATVQATVNLSRSDTPEGLKQAIEGRIMALANVHSLFVETRWIGAELSTIATQELAPYSEKDERRVRIDGPQVLLEPNAAQAIAIRCTSWQPMLPSAGLCPCPMARLT